MATGEGNATVKALKIILVLPALAYVLIAVMWQSHRINTITGDEPHYLLSSDSIIRDGDLAVVNNHRIETPVLREMPTGYQFVSAHEKNGYSIHGLGLPLLLVPAYAIGGVTGAKVFMALLAGLIPFVLYDLARSVLADEAWAVVTGLVIALGQPFLAASNQIFPDLLAGLIILWCLVRLLEIHKDVKFLLRKPKALAIGGLLGYLPWLHIKLLLPMAIIYLCYIVRLSRTPPSPGRRRSSLLLMSAMVIASLIALGAYNQFAFRSPLGPYESGAWTLDLNKIVMIFTGLHIDRMQGLFMQAPLFLLGIFGLPFFFAEQRLFAVIVALVYLSIIIPNSAHPNWYGGFSFAGRFHWSVVLLWSFPLVYAVRHAFARGKMAIMQLAYIGSMIVQMLTASVVLGNRLYLYNQSILEQDLQWLRAAPYADLLNLNPFLQSRILPSFRDFSTYLRSPTNLAYLGLLGLIAAIGYGVHKKQRIVYTAASFVWIISATIAFSAASLKMRPFELAGAELPSGAGEIVGTSRRASESDAGYVVFGPYLPLFPGAYEIALDYEANNTPEGRLRWDCAITADREWRGAVLESGELPPSQANGGVFVHRCQLPDRRSYARFEFRIHTKGGATVTVNYLSIRAKPYLVAPLPTWNLWLVPHAADATFGDLFRLRGYDLEVAPDRSKLVLTLYWQALRQPDFNYSVFAHLVDAAGQLVAQQDHAPGESLGYPPIAWAPGDLVPDEHVIDLPSHSRLDDYSVRVGVYNWVSGERLPIYIKGKPIGDYVTLEQVP